ncbi:TM2 domain-containing protein [Chryseobacterium indoltheticum]|nr:TM2 domain-containing protein [Chryseobacterium indoltheticum]
MSSDDIIKLKSSQTQNVKVKTQGLKDKNIATILALFLGGLGIHRFYLGQPLIGILYLIFCWTFIPLCLSIIDFFAFIFMSQNRFNSKYNI